MTLEEMFREEGRKEGIMKGLEEGMEKGLAEGMEKGRKRGLEEGMERGKTVALARTVVKLLTRRFGLVPEDFEEHIAGLDTPTLDAILDGIMDYKSLEDVKEHIRQ